MYLLIPGRRQQNTTIWSIFTSHYVSINSSLTRINFNPAIEFTSHYVSINSLEPPLLVPFGLHLHPTMYLLIPGTSGNAEVMTKHLHPTMYLLIPLPYLYAARLLYNLHPTMYLLIRRGEIRE